MPFSIIIPTYDSKDSLRLLLKSIIVGQVNKNQIIVVCDGKYNVVEPVLKEFAEHIDILDLGVNKGLATATNYGVYNAKYGKILLLNDDNVMSGRFDVSLEELDTTNTVWSLNQIEPFPSIFKQFVIEDLGRDPNTFDLAKLNELDNILSYDPIKIDNSGSTLPIFMNKLDYIKIGGWDIEYPGPYVVDWDFFLKCNLAGYRMMRTYSTHVYHFVSLSTNNTPERQEKRRQNEIECHQYSKWKWGDYIKHNPETNLKYL